MAATGGDHRRTAGQTCVDGAAPMGESTNKRKSRSTI